MRFLLAQKAENQEAMSSAEDDKESEVAETICAYCDKELNTDCVRLNHAYLIDQRKRAEEKKICEICYADITDCIDEMCTHQVLALENNLEHAQVVKAEESKKSKKRRNRTPAKSAQKKAKSEINIC